MVTCIADATAAEEAAAAAPDAPKTTALLKLTHQVHYAGEAIVDLRGEKFPAPPSVPSKQAGLVKLAAFWPI